MGFIATKFLFIAAILGVAIPLGGLLSPLVGKKMNFFLTATPALLAALATLFPPDEAKGRWDRLVAGLGLAGIGVHVVLTGVTLWLAAEGRITSSPALLACGVVATAAATWHTATVCLLSLSDRFYTRHLLRRRQELRSGRGQARKFLRHALSDDVLATGIMLVFAVAGGWMLARRPDLLGDPEAIAAIGFFVIAALGSSWLGARRRDAGKAAAGGEHWRPWAPAVGAATWVACAGIGGGLVWALIERGWIVQKPELIYIVLGVSAIGALVPAIGPLARRLPWRVLYDVSPEGVLEIAPGLTTLLRWSDIAAITFATYAGHPSVMVQLLRPEDPTTGRPLPPDQGTGIKPRVLRARQRRWLRSAGWTGGWHVIVIGPASRPRISDFIAMVRSHAPADKLI